MVEIAQNSLEEARISNAIEIAKDRPDNAVNTDAWLNVDYSTKKAQ